jgi:hypothetical protein
MTGAVGAFAAGLATAFVALDEGATEDSLEWGQLAQERLAALSQGGGGLLLDVHLTTQTTGLRIAGDISFVNPFLALRRNLAERAIDGVFSDRGFSIDSAV